MCDFVHYVPSYDILLVWAATGYRPASPTESICSLVASTVHNDSVGDEATEPYDDEKTETDSTVSVSASSSGSFDESGVPNSEKAELGPPSRMHSTGPPSPTRSTASNATLLYDYSDDEPAKTAMMSEDDHAETGETVMALVPCKRNCGHFCFVPVRFYPNPTPEKRKVCHCISTICEKQIAELV